MKELDNELVHWIYTLKESEAIRAVVYPLINLKRSRATARYVNSPDSNQVKKFKNIHQGKRCFIICNGPSLRIDQLNQLKKEITFGLNRVYYLFDKTDWRPDYYVAFEPEFVTREIAKIEKVEVKQYRFLNIIGKMDEAERDRKNVWLNCTSKFSVSKYSTRNIYFSNEIDKEIIDAYTVTFTALQIAAYMGFKEINLIGADHQFNKVITRDKKVIKDNNIVAHCYVDKKEDYRTYSFLEGIETGYSIAKKYADSHGILIQNLTEGGKLEIFQRDSFDNYMRRQNGNI